MKSDCFTQSEELKKSIPIHLEAAVRLQTPFKKLKEKHPRRSFFSKISGHRSPTLRQKGLYPISELIALLATNSA